VVEKPLFDLPLLRASTLVQQVHAELKQRIVDGRLAPGDEVPDSVIAKQMGVSRAPVRDACNLLVQSGLLTKQQNYPYRVRDISQSEADELQLIRYGQEIAAVRHLVRTKATPVGVQEPLELMSAAFDANDGEASARADLEFHAALVRSTGLETLAALHEAVMTQFIVMRRSIPDFAMPTQRHRHQEILDVLAESQRSNSADAIVAILTAHLLMRPEDVDVSEALQPPPLN
jgi:DNA-binding GntR family transcriptional regulator